MSASIFKYAALLAAAVFEAAAAATADATADATAGGFVGPAVAVVGAMAVGYMMLSRPAERKPNQRGPHAQPKLFGGEDSQELTEADSSNQGQQTDVAARFVEKQLAFTKNGDGTETTFKDNPVPGIGAAGQKKLEEFGVTNAAVLVGWFLRVNGDRAKMAEFLVDQCNCQKYQVTARPSNTLDVLREKCAQFVLDERDEATALLTARPEGSVLTLTFENFLNRQLSWKDDFDSFKVPKLGPVGRAKLAESKWRITNAVQLIGHYMTYNGDDQDFVNFLVDDCDLRLQEVTCRDGILQAIKDKVETFCSA